MVLEPLIHRCDKGYLLEVDAKYPRDLHDLHNDRPFMCERMKINGVEKLVPNLNFVVLQKHFRISRNTFLLISSQNLNIS